VFAGHGVPLFYCHVGRVWLCGYGFWQGFMKWKGEKVSGKNIFKNLFLPCLCMRREEEAAPCRSKRHHAVFFLKNRKKNFGSDPKMSYDKTYLFFFKSTSSNKSKKENK